MGLQTEGAALHKTCNINPDDVGCTRGLRCLGCVANISRAYIFAGRGDGAAPSLVRAVVTCASGLMQPRPRCFLASLWAAQLHSSLSHSLLAVVARAWKLVNPLLLFALRRDRPARTPQHIARIKDSQTSSTHPSPSCAARQHHARVINTSRPTTWRTSSDASTTGCCACSGMSPCLHPRLDACAISHGHRASEKASPGDDEPRWILTDSIV